MARGAPWARTSGWTVDHRLGRYSAVPWRTASASSGSAGAHDLVDLRDLLLHAPPVLSLVAFVDGVDVLAASSQPFRLVQKDL